MAGGAGRALLTHVAFLHRDNTRPHRFGPLQVDRQNARWPSVARQSAIVFPVYPPPWCETPLCEWGFLAEGGIGDPVHVSGTPAPSAGGMVRIAPALRSTRRAEAAAR